LFVATSSILNNKHQIIGLRLTAMLFNYESFASKLVVSSIPTSYDVCTFRKFVKDCVLSRWMIHEYNTHWLPAAERCGICTGELDFIGK